MSAMSVPSVSSHISPLSLRPKRHPACRRREAQSSSCTERENLAGDARGKGTSGSIPEAESTEPARLWRHGGASADNLGETGTGSLVAKPAPDRLVRFVRDRASRGLDETAGDQPREHLLPGSAGGRG